MPGVPFFETFQGFFGLFKELTGINDLLEAPGFTSGLASNSQQIRIYVAGEEGTYLYGPYSHQLIHLAAGDYRAFTLEDC
ncbi:MAG TPA: hypothetical protein VEH58_01675 [Dehalococcoidales bacterium]|nr:hypothetical protein [Dehalococcoidales bacterium]